MMLNKRGIIIFIRILTLTVVVYFIDIPVISQEPPPRPVVVTIVQNLGFGVFYQGVGGGSVTIDAAGTRTAQGSVVLLGAGAYSTAIFSVRANPGTVISFLKPTGSLSDGNGHTMNIEITDSNPESPFITTNPYSVPTMLYMGGVLTVGSPAVNPPGHYIGTLNIIFIQE